MGRHRITRTTFIVAVWIALLVPCCAFGQAAWVPPKGVGFFAISYQNTLDGGHAFADGRDYLVIGGQKISDTGTLRVQTVYLDFGYSFTNKLAVTVDLPYMAIKYNEPTTFPIGPDGQPVTTFGPHALADGTIPLDDGKYHDGFQDFGFRLRYNIATHPFMITPFIQYNTPSHAYPFYSHAVYGNHVSEFQIGSFAGGTLGSFLPNTYIHGGYSVGFPQRILGVSKIHQHGEFEGGYFISDRIRAFGILLGQISNGGLDLRQDPASFNSFTTVLTDFGPPDFTNQNGTMKYTSGNEKFFHHTQIQRDNFLDLSLGMSYSLNSSVDLYGVIVHTLTARNMHTQEYGLTFGMTWGFGGYPQRPCHC